MPQSEKWEQLCGVLRQHFHEPDTEALAIALAAARAHFYPGCLPVWVMIVGASGSGKTSVGIGALRAVPLSREVGELTPRTFISGKKGAPSLLFEGGTDHIFLFPDFSSFLDMRPDQRGEVAAQMRQIYDGSFVKDTGEKGKQHWQGKVTCIAAATHAVEDFWATNRDLGERFLSVRWHNPEPVQTAEAAGRQAGHENEIAATLRHRAGEFFGAPLPTALPVIPTDIERLLIVLATFVARCRTSVKRNQRGDEVLEVYPPEAPTRLVKATRLVICGWADLLGRAVEPDDLKLGQRIAMDSIPRRRSSVLRHFPRRDGDEGKGEVALQCLTGVPRTTLRRTLEDLHMARILAYSADTELYSWHPESIRLLQLCGLWQG